MVGIGNSGLDIAVELSRVTKQVCWSSHFVQTTSISNKFLFMPILVLLLDKIIFSSVKTEISKNTFLVVTTACFVVFTTEFV